MIRLTPHPVAGQSASSARRRGETAFSLLELLVVMGVIGLISLLTIPVLSSLVGANNFRSNIAQVSYILENAYSQALAKNTYVWVGFSQMNIDGGGVGVATVYSTHGSASDLPGQVFPLSKPVFLRNLQLKTISAGQISDPRRASQSVAQITEATNPQFTAAIGGATQTLNYVIKISPSGQVSLAATNFAWIEVGLSALNGNAKSLAAVQISSFTGRVSIYQP